MYQKRISSHSRNLPGFEEEWLQIGRDFSVIFDSGNSLVHQSQAIDGSKKRQLSEAEDSLIISRRKLARQSEEFSQQRSQEDPQIMKLRQENPNKYEALEKRTISKSTLVTPKYSPASPGYIPPFPAQFLPTPDCNLLPLSTTSESAQYPLKKELNALVELVNSVRVDLLQTSMLVNYISDYLKNWK
uniref:Uncharacterized protein n=1 Tax=Magallana gigas TaxID=29159 RepID=A0A8W8MI55_MAGGI